MNRLGKYLIIYILVGLAASSMEIIPNVTLSTIGAFLGALILNASAGAIIALLTALLIGYWQGFPLAIAGHCIVSIAMATGVYYFAEVYRNYEHGWKRYVFSIVSGYLGYIGLGMFLLWSLIGDPVLVLWIPWSISAVVCMLIAEAIDYGWPNDLRPLLGGRKPIVRVGKNRARKKSKISTTDIEKGQ